MLIAVLFPQLCYYMHLSVVIPLIPTGLKCEVMVLCTNSYKKLYECAVLLCTLLSFVSVSVTECS